MKKITLLALACGFLITSCNNSPSYKINGSVQDIANGDTIYLQEYKNGEMIKLDSAVISNGKFVFKGKQDSTVNRYLTYMKGDKRIFTDFFLENGDIKALLGPECKVTGTKDNDIYQEFKDKFQTLNKEMNSLYMKVQTDTTLADMDKEKLMKEIEHKDSIGMDMVYNTIKENITNPVGVYLLPQYAAAFDLEKQSELISKVPEAYSSNKAIAKLRERIEVAMKTAVGEKYINFSMKDPEGKTVSLSDYVNANKYTLVDFWASWCSPCRAEMPNVVAAYNKYKDLGFGIVGVSLDENGQDWKDAINTLGITWPQMSDLKGWNNEAAKLYGVNSIPATVLINNEGIIVARNLRGEAIQQQLEKFLKQDNAQQ